MATTFLFNHFCKFLTDKWENFESKIANEKLENEKQGQVWVKAVDFYFF